MATSITQTSERPQIGMNIGETQPQEESQVAEATGFSFTPEQRRLLAQTYQMILSWAKPKPQSKLDASSDAAPGTTIEMRS